MTLRLRTRSVHVGMFACLMLAILALAHAEELAMKPQLKSVVDRIQLKLPKGDQLVSTDTSFEVRYRCQDYRIHEMRHLGVIFNTESENMRGPTDSGYILNLTWHDVGYEHAFDGNAAPPSVSLNTNTDREYYWYKHQSVYRLPSQEGYIRLEYRFGENTDPELLSTIHKELKSAGERIPVIPARTAEQVAHQLEDDARKLEEAAQKWDERADELQELLEPILSKLDPRVKANPVVMWHREPFVLICEYDSRMYEVHAVDEHGHISSESHQDVGPNSHGFVIRLEPMRRGKPTSVDPTHPRPATALPLRSITMQPYWTQYTRRFRSGDLLLDISRGVGLSRGGRPRVSAPKAISVLKEIEEALEGFCGKD